MQFPCCFRLLLHVGILQLHMQIIYAGMLTYTKLYITFQKSDGLSPKIWRTLSLDLPGELCANQEQHLSFLGLLGIISGCDTNLIASNKLGVWSLNMFSKKMMMTYFSQAKLFLGCWTPPEPWCPEALGGKKPTWLHYFGLRHLACSLTGKTYEPGSKLLVLGMVIQPLIGILIMGI